MGSSGGGGSSGKVDYPSYMKDWHGNFIGGYGAETPVDTLLDNAYGTSPFAAATAYDPSTEMNNVLTKAEDTVAQINKMDQIGEQVDFEADVYPQFEGGMRDINAVQTSAFVQGRANIAADYAARLSSKKMDLCVSYSSTYIDAQKMAVLAYQGEKDKNLEIDAKNEKWDLDISNYGVTALGAIQGVSPVGSSGGKEVSDGQQALAGAASGAAMGASVGGPWGAAIGGVVGGVGGYLM